MPSIDLPERLPVRFDAGRRRCRAQVEDEPSGNERLVESAQDVHDALRLHSSERPGEEDEVKVDSLRDVPTGAAHLAFILWAP
jgi:hypothetical protein